MQIIGEVLDIIYKNDDNNYHIITIGTDTEIVTVTGTFINLAADLTYIFEVEQKHHPKYGQQYAALSYKLKMPDDAEKIKHFLASGIFEGIGPTTAEKIVDHFGADALVVMRMTPDKLKDVSGIGKATYEKIIKSFNEHIEAEEVLFFLNNLGFTPKMSYKIYDAYRSDTIIKVKDNPYRLIKDIDGLGFKKVDQIASRLGFTGDSIARTQALVLFTLSEAASSGHMYLPQTELFRVLKMRTSLDDVILLEQLQELAIEGEITIDNSSSHPRVYSRVLFDTEFGIVSELVRLSSAGIKVIDYKGNLSDLDLTEEQQKAVDKGLNHAIYILTGGPGTGKTTVLKEWVLRLELAKLSYSLCAPTGRAASRMEEVIGRPASTIHRLLEYKYQEDAQFLFFHRNFEHPLDADVIFVDEVSMLDAPLFYKLLLAIKTGSRLILIGDVNQLPAVGPGTMLADLIHSGVIDSDRLTKIHRQAADSLILKNAHAMLRGNALAINQKGKDFFFIKKEMVSDKLDTLLQVVSERLPKFYDIDPKEDIMVLTPLRSGVLGADELNKSLQEKLNPKGKLHFNRFKVGDRVMQNKNNYSIKWRKNYTLDDNEGIFNGEIGHVTDCNQNGLYVKFSDGKLAVYTRELADDLVLAYAMTIHKSQGNEFTHVVMPMFQIPQVMRSRNLIYTGITRAKKHLTFIGDVASLNALVYASGDIDRYSALDERLKYVADGV